MRKEVPVMKKTVYVCNRCGHKIKTNGTRIIPQFFDTTTDELLNEIGIPDNDAHFCLDCTKEILQELLDPPGARGGGHRNRGAGCLSEKKSAAGRRKGYGTAQCRMEQ